VWVSGDTRNHKDALKAAGFRWAPQKTMWYFRPDNWTSASRGGFDMDAIRSKYGSATPAKGKGRTKVEKQEAA